MEPVATLVSVAELLAELNIATDDIRVLGVRPAATEARQWVLNTVLSEHGLFVVARDLSRARLSALGAFVQALVNVEVLLEFRFDLLLGILGRVIDDTRLPLQRCVTNLVVPGHSFLILFARNSEYAIDL